MWAHSAVLIIRAADCWRLLRSGTGHTSVIFVNENENENGEKRENNEFVNED